MSKDNKVLAIVNGKKITEEDIETSISQLPFGSQGYYSTTSGRERLLEENISSELLYNYALEHGLEKDENYLKQLERLNRELLAKIATDSVLDTVTVDENEIKGHYLANKSEYKTEKTVTARHILLDSHEKANEVKSKIDEGMSFEDAAKQYSCCSTSVDGGNLGTFRMGTMVPELEEVAFALNIGDVGGPVESYYGHHLVKVEKKGGGETREFEDVKDIIAEKLLEKKKNAKYDELIKELEKRYCVEVKK